MSLWLYVSIPVCLYKQKCMSCVPVLCINAHKCYTCLSSVPVHTFVYLRNKLKYFVILFEKEAALGRAKNGQL